MTTETWFSFVLVVCIFAIIPGPTVILVVGQAIANGTRAIVPLTAGVVTGDFVAMSLSLIGLGAVLAASAVLFGILKWFGVFYLVYLGIKAFRTEPVDLTGEGRGDKIVSPLNLFKSAFVVTALNPKDIVFFVAFLPQFVDTTQPVVQQFLILMATFLAIVTVSVCCFATFAGAVKYKIQGVGAQKNMNRASGCVLVGAGILASTVEHS